MTDDESSMVQEWIEKRKKSNDWFYCERFNQWSRKGKCLERQYSFPMMEKYNFEGISDSNWRVSPQFKGCETCPIWEDLGVESTPHQPPSAFTGNALSKPYHNVD